MNFVKLKQTIDINQYNTKEVVQSYGNNVNGIWKGIKYHMIESCDSKKLWNIIPKEYHDDFFLRIMSINSDIPPHTDSGILCTINVYIVPSNCVTQFYSVTSSAITNQIENQTNGAIFDQTCLTFVDEFVAKPNEVWLLDVTVPHSVISIEKNSVKRLAMCLQSKTMSFESVMSILKDTNQI